MMKKPKSLYFPLIAFLALILSFFLVSSVSAVDSRKIVRVGFFPFFGYHVIDAEGQKSGYGYEYLQHMKMYADWDYQYVGYETQASWNDMQTMLKNGEIDLLTSATKTAERETYFDYSNDSIGVSSTLLTVKAGNTKYTASNFDSWNGIRVGMLLGNSRNDSFATYASQKGFTYTPVYFDTETELTSNLSSESIDAIVTSNLRHIQNEWTIAEFDAKPFYVIVKKGNSSLLAEVNNAISQIEANEPNLLSTLFHKYYSPDNSDEIPFTQEETAFIASSKAASVSFSYLMNPDSLPYSYLENGEMKGIFADLSEEVFSRTGLKFNLLSFSSRSQYVEAQQNIAADVCADFCSNYSHAEKEGYVISASYYTVAIAKVTRKTFKGEIKSLGILTSDLIKDEHPELFTGITNVEFKSNQEMIDGLNNSTIDACYLLNNSAQAIVSSDERNQLACVTVPHLTITMSFAVSKSSSYLLPGIINKAFYSIDDAQITSIAAPYVTSNYEPKTFIGFIYEYPVVFGLILFAIFLLGATSVVLVLVKKRQLAEARTNEALKEAAEIANKANKSKTEFISRISHDIRTPINIISGMTEFAYVDKNNEKKLTDDLDKIKSANIFLLSLINDVLDISRIDSGKVELQMEPTDCDSFADNINNLFGPLCEEKKLHFVTSNQAQGLIFIGDKVRLNQIAMNLLSNSVKYTKVGGTVSFELIGTRQADGMINLQLVVSDNGIGMSEEFQKTMFDPFAQEFDNPQRQKTASGTGLGLAIVQRLIELMGGKISVKSKLNEGSKFTCSFLFEEGTKEALRKNESNGWTSSLPTCSGKLLLAEDNPMNAEIAMRILEKYGYKVQLAEDGKRAVDIFSNSKNDEYTAILMDIQMPNLNGYEAAKAIRALDRSDAHTIPIIAMTADAFSEDIKHAKEVGMDGHVSKPIDPERLYQVLAGSINKGVKKDSD